MPTPVRAICHLPQRLLLYAEHDVIISLASYLPALEALPIHIEIVRGNLLLKVQERHGHTAGSHQTNFQRRRKSSASRTALLWCSIAGGVLLSYDRSTSFLAAVMGTTFRFSTT